LEPIGTTTVFVDFSWASISGQEENAISMRDAPVGSSADLSSGGAAANPFALGPGAESR
jgi:hypothetical protein